MPHIHRRYTSILTVPHLREEQRNTCKDQVNKLQTWRVCEYIWHVWSLEGDCVSEGSKQSSELTLAGLIKWRKGLKEWCHILGHFLAGNLDEIIDTQPIARVNGTFAVRHFCKAWIFSFSGTIVAGIFVDNLLKSSRFQWHICWLKCCQCLAKYLLVVMAQSSLEILSWLNNSQFCRSVMVSAAWQLSHLSVTLSIIPFISPYIYMYTTSL